MDKLNNVIYADTAAKIFEEAFLLGSGCLGATVYGKAKNEEISLNHDTLWSGYPKNKNRVGAYKHLPEIRALIDEKKLDEAKDLIHSELLSDFADAYQPAGKLLISFDGLQESENTERFLLLDKGIVETNVSQAGISISTNHFCSYKRDVLVTRITSDKSTDASVSLNSEHPFKIEEGNGVISLLANAPLIAEPSYFPCDNPITYEKDGQKGMAFAISTCAVTQDGGIVVEDGKILLKGFKQAVIITRVETGYNGYDKLPQCDPAPLRIKAEEQVLSLLATEYNSLYDEQVIAFGELYNRTSLSLGENPKSELPLVKRLEAIQSNPNSEESSRDYPALCELLFNFGRYLLIASSKKGTQAANLQGIWNEETRPPWSSNYTININTQMNYWAAESTGLHECHFPLLQLIKELSVTGAKTAREQYNMRGWVAHHNTDLWRQSNAVGRREGGPVVYGYWPMGGAWLCLHLYDMWQYSKDDSLLAEIYPIIKGASEFVLDFLCTDGEGRIVTSPSTSPENPFIYNGNSFPAYKMCTMDIAIIKQLFEDTEKLAKALGVDVEFQTELISTREKMPGYRIAGDGRLAEWLEDFGETDVHHRHVSHLLGLYPGKTIKSKELREACKQSLIMRGDDGTGWSLAWKACLWATLYDGDGAYRLTKRMLNLVDKNDKTAMKGGGVYPNLLCAHPPFQIDGNFGITAAIASFFLQSDNKELRVLPALPSELKKGSVKGLSAYGGLTVSIDWEDEKAKTVVISAKEDADFILYLNGNEKNVSIKKGEKISIN